MNKTMKNIATPLVASAIIVAGLAGSAATDAIPNPLPNAVAGNVIKASDINDIATAVGILDERTFGLQADSNGKSVALEGDNETTFSIASTGADSKANLLIKNDEQEWGLRVQANNVLAIWNKTNATLPIQIESLAPSNSLIINDAGNVGIGLVNSDAKFQSYTNHNGIAAAKFKNYGSSSTALAVYSGDGASNSQHIVRWGNRNEDLLGVISETGALGIGTISPSSRLQVVGLVDYIDNAAAIAAGLTAGAFYHTAGDLKVVY